MKTSKITVLREFVPQGVLPNITEQCIADAMDTYAQQKAEKVVKELEVLDKDGYCGGTLRAALLTIKKHFNLV